MADQRDRKFVEDYFATPPKWPWYVGIIGVLLLFIGFSGGEQGTAVLGLVLAGIGGFFAFQTTKRPADAEIDALLASDLTKLRARALEKTQIEDEGPLRRDAILVYAPRLQALSGIRWGAKKGKDGYGRFTPLNVTILNFSENQLSAYQCALDLRTGVPHRETTAEYFYKDIVSVQTATSSHAINEAELDPDTRRRAHSAGLIQNGMVNLKQSESFALTTSGGTSVSMDLPSAEVLLGLGGGQFPKTNADDAVSAVRKMLREKKAS